MAYFDDGDVDNYQERMNAAWAAATPEERKAAMESAERSVGKHYFKKNGEEHPAVAYGKACGNKGSYVIKDPFFNPHAVRVPLWVTVFLTVAIVIVLADICILWGFWAQGK